MLKITVSGPPGCGKTTMAKVIQERLHELGFNALLDDTDKVPDDMLEQRINSIKETKSIVLIGVKQDYRRVKYI